MGVQHVTKGTQKSGAQHTRGSNGGQKKKVSAPKPAEAAQVRVANPVGKVKRKEHLPLVDEVRFTVAFGWEPQEDHRLKWCTRVYDEKMNGEEEPFYGRDPTPWVDWLLKRSNTPAEGKTLVRPPRIVPAQKKAEVVPPVVLNNEKETVHDKKEHNEAQVTGLKLTSTPLKVKDIKSPDLTDHDIEGILQGNGESESQTFEFKIEVPDVDHLQENTVSGVKDQTWDSGTKAGEPLLQQQVPFELAIQSVDVLDLNPPDAAKTWVNAAIQFELSASCLEKAISQAVPCQVEVSLVDLDKDILTQVVTQEVAMQAGQTTYDPWVPFPFPEVGHYELRTAARLHLDEGRTSINVFFEGPRLQIVP